GQMFGLMIWGGISTFVFGALTGGFMGDFIPQFAKIAFGKDIALPALFSPLDSITTILIGSMALGVVQIVTGMAISVVLKCKKGQFLDAFFGEITWWVVFAGLALMVLKVTPYVLYAGIALVVIGPLVQGKGFGKITGIFSSIYSNVTGYFGDILSYSRLMALMLSGCVIAQVFNTLAALFGSVIPFVIVALIGNLFNMALNILGCFVHDLRLQCLEFFNKFYEDGGKPFEPLENRTKYVDIQ
ncbi:MAG: V-type ATP synthase subunit I, partial [Firmicutes bacterium]|nr:V-type ATP synthase subunit I [Bacillota bacterium]